MNLLSRKFIKFKNSNVKVKYEKNSIRIINDSDTHGFLILPHIFRGNKVKSAHVDFYGKIENGNGAVFEFLDFKRNILSEMSFNSSSSYLVNSDKFFGCIKINRKSEVVINKAEISINEELSGEFDKIINSENDILIITPSYPTEENKYFGGFVHSRVKAYKEAGIKFDLVCAHAYKNTCTYSYEGIDVTRTSFNGLRNILTSKKYKTILLHFFDNNYAKVLDACDLSSSNLYFWIHGPETLYWDWSKMTDEYFKMETPLSSEYIELFERNDCLINRYNDYDNVHWVFVSNWIKDRSEELIGIKFKNFFVIPNFIDEKVFDYNEKSADLRKKIFFVRRFENISKYAIDVNVRTILELSRRDFFEDLEFNIYGTGENYDTLVAPIKDFPNVHLYQRFLSHEQISEIHKKNGIGLFATRYDAQGVSMCEAAMSGLAIVSSDNDAIAEFIPSEEGNLCETENYVAYADMIEKLYRNPELFVKLSKDCHNKVYDQCKFDDTIKKEIELIKNIEFDKINKEIVCKKSDKKVLSIIIPSYNVSKYLYHGVYTMLEHDNCSKIEIIIVNDGSKDNTLEVAKKLQERYTENCIVIIDKPNGGHGSTINAGLKIASGKYVRIIDGDDWVNTADMQKLVDVLEKESSDIVLTDYCEDRAEPNELIHKKIYEFMIPGKVYNFDDLCYDGYGFDEWGPILATANFKTEILKNSFTLSEKCFYIDMEFDTYSITKAKTISYYPLDIYRYFIGRVDQSISKQSYIRNYKQHEKVLFNIINFYSTNTEVSERKKRYIYNKIIIPLVIANYTIVNSFKKSPKDFREFEGRLKKYPEIYNDYRVATRMKKLHRKTNGVFVKYEEFIRKVFLKILRRG